jgi:DNA-binding Lrp family transcriptional regulator
LRVDDIDRRILSLLVDDARRTYDDIGRHVSLSAPAVKRRIDRLRSSGVLVGFSAVLDYEALGWNTEALIELFWVRGTRREEVAESLRRFPNVIEAWTVTGEADTVVRVRTQDHHDFEQLVYALHSEGYVERTRSAMILHQLVGAESRPV